MGKQIRLPKKNFIRTILLFLAVSCVGIYGFTQAMQVPLSQTAAEKVLSAWNILRGTSALPSWRYNLFELPVYLICVKILGISTFAAIAADTCFFLILFTAGIAVLYSRHLLSPLSFLIWLILTGLPDPLRMEAIQSAPITCLGLILSLHFLSAIIEKHDLSKIIPLLISGILLFSPSGHPGESTGMQGQAFLKTLGALHKIFKADFFGQQLMNIKTAGYFLMTMVMILFFFCIFRTLFHMFRHEYAVFELICAAAALLTVLYCCSTPAESPETVIVRCAWLPYGGAILLICASQRISARAFSLKQRPILFTVSAVIFSGIFIFLCADPVLPGRPASPADRVISFLNERGLTRGYCGSPDLAIFTVSGKGKIEFTPNAEDPENTFFIFSTNSDVTEREGETAEFGSYQVRLRP